MAGRAGRVAGLEFQHGRRRFAHGLRRPPVAGSGQRNMAIAALCKTNPSAGLFVEGETFALASDSKLTVRRGNVDAIRADSAMKIVAVRERAGRAAAAKKTTCIYHAFMYTLVLAQCRWRGARSAHRPFGRRGLGFYFFIATSRIRSWGANANGIGAREE
jgi:hypothetical protein